jgi:hypothetical protein
VISLSRWTIGIHWWTVPFQVALMLLLAVASYRYIETPFRRSDTSAFRLLSIVVALAGSMVAAVPLSALVIRYHGLSLYSGRTPSLVAAGAASLKDPYPFQVQKDRLRDTGPGWAGRQCVLADNSDVGRGIPLSECTLGNFFTARQRVLVLGNSFSAAFTQAFDDLVLVDDYAVTITSSWGASPVPTIPNTTPWRKENDWYWKHVIPELSGRLQAGDWVFLVNDLAEFSPSKSTPQSKAQLQKLRIGLEQFSERLSAQGVRLAVLHGIPLAREANCDPVIAVRQWFHPFGSPCRIPDRSSSLQRRQNLDHMLMALQQQGKIQVIDIFDVFCPDDSCTYTAPSGEVLYRDAHSHPSVEAVRLAAPILRRHLTSRSALDASAGEAAVMPAPRRSATMP